MLLSDYCTVTAIYIITWFNDNYLLRLGSESGDVGAAGPSAQSKMIVKKNKLSFFGCNAWYRNGFHTHSYQCKI